MKTEGLMGKTVHCGNELVQLGKLSVVSNQNIGRKYTFTACAMQGIEAGVVFIRVPQAARYNAGRQFSAAAGERWSLFCFPGDEQARRRGNCFMQGGMFSLTKRRGNISNTTRMS